MVFQLILLTDCCKQDYMVSKVEVVGKVLMDGLIKIANQERYRLRDAKRRGYLLPKER